MKQKKMLILVENNDNKYMSLKIASKNKKTLLLDNALGMLIYLSDGYQCVLMLHIYIYIYTYK